ncbi:MAG: ABC transporter ATP-binding protein [Bryobacterales bacterium]|nr:ABC transporter ATP-binding protein [Bryobacteraceae bacterium]MDW8356076.1 ABC transporter ATP-binding protein [Bryobacterales bacterium]
MVLAEKVSKVYHLYRRPFDRILETFYSTRRRLGTEFWALRDVTLSAGRGEFVGIVGPNGSGKSTLLQILSGIIRPTTGRVYTEGRIAALLELGAGFNPEFTGRENVYLNGEILGLSRREVDRVFPSIEAFAEIGEFIDRPVKEYSAGMYVRLAFATAIHVEPDILIVDEALAVGDAIFANRCIRKFEELKRRKVTVLFVSHDLGLVKRLSDRALLLVGGRVAAEGSPAEVINRYVGLVLERQGDRPAELTGTERQTLQGSFRHGDGASELVEVELLGPWGTPVRTVCHGESVSVRVRARFHKDVERPVVGMLIRNRLGTDVFGTNTRLEGCELGPARAGEELTVEFRFVCLLAQQEYTLTVATQYWEGFSQDWRDDVLAFSVIDPRGGAGVASFPTQVTWQREPTYA